MLLQNNQHDIRIHQQHPQPNPQPTQPKKGKPTAKTNLSLDAKSKKPTDADKREQYLPEQSHPFQYAKEGPGQALQETFEGFIESEINRVKQSMGVPKKAEGSENDEIQSQYDYAELSAQLSKALVKVQGKGKGQGQGFLDRVEYFESKKQRWLNQAKHQRQLQESKLSAKASLTNANSERMLHHYEPIQSRYEKIVEEKKRKVQRQQEERSVREREELQQYARMQMQRSSGNLRTKEEFFDSVYSWKERKEEKILRMAQQEQKAEMEGVTFTPAINSKSKLMAKRIGKVPIYDQEVRAKRVEADPHCTFHPLLHKPRK